MAATITKGKTFGATEEVTNAKLHQLVDAATIANVDQTNMAASIGVVETSTSNPSDTDALWKDTSASPSVMKFHDGTDWTAIRGGTIPLDYRRELYCRRTASTTLNVDPGYIEVNSSIISVTSTTGLTISTAGDWAGGSSLQATNTTGYVMIDKDGNIKLGTTAPTHADYGLSITVGTKRYASVSSTTCRFGS